MLVTCPRCKRSLSTEERESAWDEVEVAMRDFESPGRFDVPGECLVGAATK